jgi:hypothetical protein
MVLLFASDSIGGNGDGHHSDPELDPGVPEARELE